MASRVELVLVVLKERKVLVENVDVKVSEVQLALRELKDQQELRESALQVPQDLEVSKVLLDLRVLALQVPWVQRDQRELQALEELLALQVQLEQPELKARTEIQVLMAILDLMEIQVLTVLRDLMATLDLMEI